MSRGPNGWVYVERTCPECGAVSSTWCEPAAAGRQRRDRLCKACRKAARERDDELRRIEEKRQEGEERTERVLREALRRDFERRLFG